jgi:hypothetical protein
MSARTGLLAGAAVSAWSALLLATLAAGEPARLVSAVVVVAALAVPLLWAPLRVLHSAVPLLVGLVCVVLAAGGSSPAAAGLTGVLLLAHVLLADLAADAVGASAPAVRAALAELAPALLVGAVTALLLVAGVAVAGDLPGRVGTALRMLAPFLLLVAALLALGLASRRPSWEWVPQRSGLSALTRRYLDRLARER